MFGRACLLGPCPLHLGSIGSVEPLSRQEEGGQDRAQSWEVSRAFHIHCDGIVA